MQNTLTQVQLTAPYLILIGQQDDPTYAKTGLGIVQWRPELVAGQLRFPGCEVDLGVPDMTVDEAVSAGARSLLIGVAPVGGAIPDSWWELIEQAARSGLDVVSGLHIKLNNRESLVEIARASGARLIDVRTPPKNLPIGNGKKRSGRRVLMVGTDCAIGKKYTALALHKSMQDAGMNATFRATGQTGIMIAGEGVPIDAVIADFISGAAEVLSPDNAPDHWDVIEGQGSLFHPAYSGVSMGLLLGSQPYGFVVCNDAGRMVVSGLDHYPLPSLAECIDLHVQVGKRTNPAIRCVGISVNTSSLKGSARTDYLAALEAEHGVPAVDSLIDGCGAIAEHIRKTFGA